MIVAHTNASSTSLSKEGRENQSSPNFSHLCLGSEEKKLQDETSERDMKGKQINS